MTSETNLPDLLAPIKDSLSEINEAGSFYAIEFLTHVNFQVLVNNYGRLKFPLTKEISRTLISLAKPAKFGLGEKTLYDPKVRDVWEIPGKEITINDVSNEKKFDIALNQIKQKLGLPSKSILYAELHNLLIYEEDQFFTSHQDSEKSDGMVATLVVILPSSYKGGTLQIEHQNEKAIITSDDTPQNKLSFVAFYADCLHSIQPITSGYRVALTFNLILKGNRSHQETNIQNNLSLKKAIHHFFQEKNIENKYTASSPKKLVYLLDHEYTDAGLSWQTLKNSDRLRAEALLNVAKDLELTIHLGLAELQETWDAMENSDSYIYGRNNYYDEESEEDEDIEDYEDEPDDDIDNLELNSLIEEVMTIKTWVNSDDKKEDFQKLSHYCWDIIATTPNDEFTPYQSEYEGYMGNYGNTLDRWYHRAVVILWQKIDTQSIFLEFNPNKVIEETLQLAKNKTTWQFAYDSTKQFISHWDGLKESPLKINSINNVFKLSNELNDIDIAFSFIIPLGVKCLTPETTPELGLLIKKYGKNFGSQLFERWGNKNAYFSDLHINDFDKFIISLLKHKDPQVNSFIEWCLLYRFDLLKKHHQSSKDRNQFATLRMNSPTKIKDLLETLNACFASNNIKVHQEITDYILSDVHSYPTLEISKQFINYFQTKSSIDFKTWHLDILLSQLLQRLQSELIQRNRDPNDWGIKEINICNCQYCKILNPFLLDGASKEKVWPLAKNHRQHIHQIIEQMILPVSHKTIHEGSPHKLVLKKTKQLFTDNNILQKELNETIDSINKLIIKMK